MDNVGRYADDVDNGGRYLEEPDVRFDSNGKVQGLKDNELPTKGIGIKLKRPLSPSEMANLTRKYGVEFALAREIGGTNYWLFAGEKSKVYVPYNHNGYKLELIVHTHPGNSRYPSTADIRDLENRKQSVAYIIPIGSDNGDDIAIPYYPDTNTDDYHFEHSLHGQYSETGGVNYLDDK